MLPGAKRRGMEIGMERKYYLRGLGLGIVVTAVIMGVALSGRRRMTDEQIIARAKELGMVENTLLSEEAAGDAEIGDAAEDAADGDAAADNTGAADDAATAGDTTAEDNVAGEQTDVTETTQEQDEAGGSMADDTAAEGQIDGSAADDAAAEDNTAGEQTDATDNAETADDTMADDAAEGQTDGSTVDDAAAAGNASGTGSVVITIRGGDSSYTVAKKLEDLGVVASASAYDTYLCGHGYDKRLRTGTFSIPADADEEQIARIVTGGE